VSGQFHTPVPLSQGERATGSHWIRGWVGLRACFDDMENWKFLPPPEQPLCRVSSFISSFSDYGVVHKFLIIRRWLHFGIYIHNILIHGYDLRELQVRTRKNNRRVRLFYTISPKKCFLFFVSSACKRTLEGAVVPILHQSPWKVLESGGIPPKVLDLGNIITQSSTVNRRHEKLLHFDILKYQAWRNSVCKTVASDRSCSFVERK
jgi:hypothetical protein